MLNGYVNSIGLADAPATGHDCVLARVVEVGKVGQTFYLGFEFGVGDERELGIEMLQVGTESYGDVYRTGFVVDDRIADFDREMIGAREIEVADVAFVASGDQQPVFIHGVVVASREECQASYAYE